MEKLIKKSMSVAMAVLMVFGVFVGTTNVFANEGNLEHKVVSNLVGKVSGTHSKVTGTVDISKTVSNSSLKLKEGTANTYEGVVSGSVEAGDLFEGAYILYKDKFYNLRTIKGYWRNFVMFGPTKKSFPTCSYTVTFPDNITVDKANVVATENTNTISKIETKAEDHSVTFTFYLGNWNDYEGFFKLFEGERNKSGHSINVSIPYTVDIDENSPSVLGTIKGSGECKLYKFGFIAPKKPIVSITSPEISFNVSNPR